MKSIGIQISDEIYNLLMKEAQFEERSIASQIRIILKQRYRDQLNPAATDHDTEQDTP